MVKSDSLPTNRNAIYVPFNMSQSLAKSGLAYDSNFIELTVGCPIHCRSIRRHNGNVLPKYLLVCLFILPVQTRCSTRTCLQYYVWY